jgi:hypothetical protein
MIDINKEAEEYAEFGKTTSKWQPIVQNTFIAGHNSKATQAKVIQGQIELLLHLRDTFQFSMASSNWKNKLIELQKQLKELENE